MKKISLLMPVVIFFALLAAYSPMDIITGKWSGEQEIFADFKKGSYPSTYEEDYFLVELQINPDGTVNGKAGEAVFVDCRCEKNRSWFGKLLNIKTDYIIKGGYLSGKISSEDSKVKREFTIPFNIEDGTLKGSIMETFRWEYPNPLFPRLKLEKETGIDEMGEQKA